MSAQQQAVRQDSISISVGKDFDFANPDYVALFEKAGKSAFQHPIWLANFYKHIVPNRQAEAVILTACDAAGNLMLLLPLVLRSKAGMRLLEPAELGVSDYCAPVIDPTVLNDHAAMDDLRHRVTAALPNHDVFRAQKIRDEHRSLWNSLFEGQMSREDFSAHATDISEGYASWTADRLSSGMRKSLKRKRNKFFRQEGARFERVSAAQVGGAVEQIKKWRVGRFEGDLIQQDFFMKFYRQVAIDGYAAGFAQVYRLAIGGQVLGYTYALNHDGRMLYLLIGCDYDTFGTYSPGLVLYDLMIEDFASQGGALFDFTIGDEPFKLDFATTETKIYTMTSAATLRGKLARAALLHAQSLQARLAHLGRSQND